jgi:hypothetical protein
MLAEPFVDLVFLLPEAGEVACLQLSLEALKMAFVEALPLQRVLQRCRVLLG